MRPDRDRIVAVGGAVAVVVIVVGLAAVEANTGPFPHEVGPAALDAELTGTFLVERDDGPGCGTDLPGSCDPPRTEIGVRVSGLPHLGSGARYVGLLEAGGDEETLASLEPASGAHEIAWAGEVDGDRFDRLVVEARLEDGSDGVPVLVHPLPTSDGETAALRDRFPTVAVTPSGRVELAQIGAVEVAVTARGTVSGLPEAPGWTPTAWLVDGRDVPTSLGAMEGTGEGMVEVDAREERVVLVEQERFLVTLEPDGGGDGVRGLPVAETTVEARSLSSLLD